MSIQFKVSGSSADFDLTDYEIRGFEFGYKVLDSQYAKGYEDERCLKVIGDISRTVEKSAEAMEIIRKWSVNEYENEGYYHLAKVSFTYSDKIVREITFPDAFIKEYTEEIDPYTGHGTYEILLCQKLDKRIDIIVDPFNIILPKLEEAMTKGDFSELEKKAKNIFISSEPMRWDGSRSTVDFLKEDGINIEQSYSLNFAPINYDNEREGAYKNIDLSLFKKHNVEVGGSNAEWIEMEGNPEEIFNF